MIEFEQVAFRFDRGQGSPAVLDGLDLTVEDGAHLALLGRNGSGKSTVARLANGLLTASGGRVLVDGLDPARADSLPAVRRSVQLVFQNPENQQVGTTVFEDIAFGLSNFAVPTEHMPARAAEALEAVGLEVPLDREVATLSGGQLQRLALAGVIALRPRHLVLDEVTAMLDPASRAHVMDSVARLRAQTGLAVLQITHHLDEVVDADAVAVLIDGRIVRVDEPAAVFADAALLDAAGLEAPYRWRQSRGVVRVPPPPEPSPSVEGSRISLDAVAVDYSVRRSRRRRRRPPVGGDPALGPLDLEFGPGITALAGRSGAGKTTLITTLKGVQLPTSGRVLVGGVDPHAEKAPELFDGIGYLFQNPEHQLFAKTVREDVGFAIARSGDAPDARRARVDAALRRVGLDPVAIGDVSPFELSGGQQRRVALAGILVGEPRGLVLDEPTAGLDHPSRRSLFALFEEARAAGASIIWVSHRLDEVLEHADRLVVLEKGQVVADGLPHDVLADRDLLCGLGWPLLPELDPDVRAGEALEGRSTANGASS